MIDRRKNRTEGYTLVEMVIYLSILSVISFMMIRMTLTFVQGYRALTVVRALDNSGLDALERMTRDIRGATSIDTANSTFGTSPGVLTLIATNGSTSTT